MTQMNATSGNGSVNLEQIAANYRAAVEKLSRRVVICAGTGCMAGGALKVFDRFVSLVAAAGLPVTTELKPEEGHSHDGLYVSKSGCQGFCQMGPLVTIEPDNILYTHVKPDDVGEIVETTLQKGQVVERLLYVSPTTGQHCRGPAEIPFYRQQRRTVLKSCGRIDPEDIHEYIEHGGYAAARKAYCNMTPENICEELMHSGLRGRGGGGFPTGRKWELTRVQPGPKNTSSATATKAILVRSWTVASWKAIRTASSRA